MLDVHLTVGGLTLQVSNYFKVNQTSFQTGVDKFI